MAESSDIHTQQNDSDKKAVRCDRKTTFWSRRGVMAASGTAMVALSGCTGILGGGSGGSDIDGPAKPWTTEELAEAAQEAGQTSINVYSNGGESSTWRTWESVIQEEYPWFEIDSLVTGLGGDINQRVVQEYQTGEITVDVAGETATSLEDTDLARDIFERDYANEYAIAEEYPTAFTDLFVSTHNRGPTLGLPYHTELVEERGLDLPQSYNDLLDDPQYEGVDMLLVQEPNFKRFGWIVNYHSQQKGMEPEEWLSEIADTVNLIFGPSSQHTTTARFLGSGEVAPMMFYSYPWTVNKTELEGMPIANHFVDNIPYFIASGCLSEMPDAPNPWGARFFISASLEPFVQKALASEIPEFTPEREDVDYSDVDISEEIEDRIELFGNMNNISFSEIQELREIGTEAFTEVFGTPEVDVS